jgi:Ca2+-binding EF-hand superfamily protein
LKAVSLTCALSVNEKNLLFQSFPTDTFGRLIYKDFENALFEVKMATMRNMILESQGSDLHRVLMQMCRDEDRNILNQSSVYSGSDDKLTDSSPALTGWLPMRALVNIMVGSPRLCLSRLQVMVITSEADVVDGKVNYHLFCPVAAKTIELMFEPKALKQRAELIETSDLSPETLLNGTSNEVFVERLESLFQAHDTDKLGELDAKQFRSMLEAMDLMLSPAEILSIMAIADNNGNGLISFDEFSKFCIKNLLHLEREKHIRVLQKSLHGSVVSGEHGNMTDRASFVRMLNLLFSEADPERTGVVSYRQLQDIFIKLDKKLSQYQILFLISECNANENGLVEYEKYIETCVDFLEVIFTIKAEGDENDFDVTFENKIGEYEQSWSNNLEFTVANIQRELKLLQHISDKEARHQMIVRIAKNRLNGLNQSESNILISMLLCDDEDEVSDDDIVSMLRKIRLHSLVRGVMENTKSATLAKYMLAVLTEAADELRRAKKDAEPPILLPVRRIIDSLEGEQKIPINRVQILTLLASTDAFHGVASGIDFREFAFAAANHVSKMFSVDCMELRAEIAQQLKSEHIYDLFGITETEIVKHLEDKLSVADNLDGCVSGVFDWRSFLPWCYGCIATVVRERLIGRRLLLRMPESNAATEMDSIIELQKMADKLSALMQVRKSAGTISIILKSEVKPDNKRFSLLVPKGSPQKLMGTEMHDAAVNESVTKDRGDTPLESYEILRMAKMIPLRGRSTDQSIVDGLYMTLRVSENDPIISFDKPPLHITACTVDCKYTLELPLYLRLPSLGLVDQDAARQFSKNLVDQLYIQFNASNSQLELAID